jgi:hypothetical protein
MKRILALLIVMLVSLIYFTTLRTKTEQQTREANVTAQLEEKYEHYAENYPKTIEDVLIGHDTFMKLQYSQGMTKEDVSLSVKGIRLFYAKKTLELNPEATQIVNLENDLITNKEKGFYLLDSKIGVITYQGEEVLVKVTYDTTTGQIEREYILSIEDDLWKIREWR